MEPQWTVFCIVIDLAAIPDIEHACSDGKEENSPLRGKNLQHKENTDALIQEYLLWLKIILPTLPLNSVVGQCPGFCLGSCSKFPLRKYYYVDMSRTWLEAQQYCREHYTDLATFDNIDDVNRLEAPFSYSWAWIGLWDDPNSWKNEMGNESNSWRWSATGETSKTVTQANLKRETFKCECDENLYLFMLFN
uniref:C-type lectin domain-containing protein n=1 Tax=Fundulus heteroclitus TaxID=8078 RepID=A0A3Q2P8Q3_FUNHE